LVEYPINLTLTYGSSSWKYKIAQNYDGIIIDCNAETVKRMSDGANLYGNVDSLQNDYFELTSGNVEIGILTTGLGAYPNNLVVIVEFTPQNLG